MCWLQVLPKASSGACPVPLHPHSSSPHTRYVWGGGGDLLQGCYCICIYMRHRPQVSGLWVLLQPCVYIIYFCCYLISLCNEMKSFQGAPGYYTTSVPPASLSVWISQTMLGCKGRGHGLDMEALCIRGGQTETHVRVPSYTSKEVSSDSCLDLGG